MRKIVFFGFMASVLIYTGAALADSATLTTQDYVDGGLRALYRTIDGKKADTTKVYTKEEADGKFLTEHQDISGKADAATTLSGYGITDAYTKSEVDTKVANIVAGDIDEALSGKQDAIEDLTTIRSGAAAGATAVQPAALNDYALKTSVPSKTSELTNDSGYLTAHQDISGKADAATTLSGYGITDAYTKSEVDTKVANIVAGDMTEALSGKQDAIEDLTTIRSGAAAGATAVQPAALNDYALKTSIPSKTSDLTNDSGYLTAHQDISGKQDAIEDLTTIRSGAAAGATAVQPAALNDYALKTSIPSKTSDLTNDSGYLTAHQDISGKQDAIEDLSTIRSGAAAGATAVQPVALNDYALKTSIPSKTSDLTNDSGYLTAHQDISGKADKTEIPSKTSELTNDSGYITETALNDYLTTANAETAYQPKGTYVENPTLPDTSGNFVLVVNRDDNNNYTYSWKSAGNSGGSGGDSGDDDDWFDDSDW